ncbi:hypothetical protein ALP55_200034 [Pseudomonas coronafaciens pv. oryzae]|nr:hypothetical protein ALP55_200034 [Pseudomonas coronafaciens pv. oryzae]
MQKGAGVGATRETMDIAAAKQNIARGLRVETLVIKELLRLRAVRRLVGTGGYRIANAQSTVGSDPPVLGSTAFRHQQFDQRGVVARRAEAVVGGLGNCLQDNRAAAFCQVTQPHLEVRRLGQRRATTQQITQRRTVQHRVVGIATLEVSDAQPASVFRAGERDIQQAQVFCQTLVVGLSDQRFSGLQTDLRATLGVVKL